MSTTLQDQRVAAALDRMYAETREQTPKLRDMRDQMSKTRTAQERADAMSTFYIPVTPEAGRLLYSLVRATRPATIVEFGMSFGISALHLASGVRDNGSGRVLTTELSADKIAAAKKTFAETGLDDLITILEGDCAFHACRSGWSGRFRAARRLEGAVRSGDQAARTTSVIGRPRRRRQHGDGRREALPRPRPQRRERIRERQFRRPRERQHGNQLPRRHIAATI